MVARSENAADAIKVFDKALDTAGQPPSLFLTDNGSAFNQTRRGFTSQLVTHVESLGTRAITGRPRHPQTQGKDERIHQTSQRWLAAHPVETLEELVEALSEFDQTYNHHRPHQSLGMQTPAQALTQRPRAIPPLPPDPGQTRRQPTSRPALTAGTYHADRNGYLSVRRHWINMGRDQAHITVTVVASGDTLAIFNHHGTLLRTVALIPGKRYYGNGKKSPGRPKQYPNCPD